MYIRDLRTAGESWPSYQSIMHAWAPEAAGTHPDVSPQRICYGVADLKNRLARFAPVRIRMTQRPIHPRFHGNEIMIESEKRWVFYVEITQILSAREFLRRNRGWIKSTGNYDRNEKYNFKKLEILRIKGSWGEQMDRRFFDIAFGKFLLLSREMWNVTHFYQNAFEILAHSHAAQFDAEVADLESRSLGLDLRLLLTGVDARHF